MTTTSMAEIVNTACKMTNKSEKIEWLKANNSKPLRNVLKIMYDDTLELNIPNTAPPYHPSESPDSHGMLYRETRKLQYFVKGYAGDGLTPLRRESVFIQMLESVDRDDAVLLIQMINQKPLPGLTAATINAAFGEIVPAKKYGKNAKKI